MEVTCEVVPVEVRTYRVTLSKDWPVAAIVRNPGELDTEFKTRLRVWNTSFPVPAPVPERDMGVEYPRTKFTTGMLTYFANVASVVSALKAGRPVLGFRTRKISIA